MPEIPIHNVGAIGVVKDLPAEELPPEAWTDVTNVRFKDGHVEKLLGEASVIVPPSFGPHFLMPWATGGVYYWIYADGDQIVRTDGTTHTTITRLSSSYAGGTRPVWVGHVYGGVPIMNLVSKVEPPQQWDGTTSRFIDLSNWPAATTATVVVPFKQALVALNITASSVEKNTLVKWSDFAGFGSLPSWDETDPTTLAGERALSVGNDPLVDALALGDILVLYRENSTWGMQLVGGQSVFATWQLFGKYGALTQHCVQEIAERHMHFVVAQGDVIVHNGRNPQSIIKPKLRDWLFNTIDDTFAANTFTFLRTPQREVGIAFVEAGSSSTYANLAILWNWQQNTWTIRQLSDVACAAEGLINATPGGVSFDSGTGVTFDNDSRAYNERQYNPSDEHLLFGKVFGSKDIKEGDIGNTFSGTAFLSCLERQSLAISGVDRQGNLKANPSLVKFCRRIYFNFTADPGVILTIRLGTQMQKSDNIAWETPVAFDPNADAYIDCMLSWALLSIRIEETGTGHWRFESYRLDLDVIARL